jgi:hypothetical protein
MIPAWYSAFICSGISALSDSADRYRFSSSAFQRESGLLIFLSSTVMVHLLLERNTAVDSVFLNRLTHPLMRSATREERTFVPPCFYLCPTFPTRSRLPDSLRQETPQQHAKPSSLHCPHERESTHQPSTILPSLLLSLTEHTSSAVTL